MKKSIIVAIIFFTAFMFGKTAHADLNEGMVAYYPFNSDANDESGNGNDGTVYGATLTEDRLGKANSAYSFDGVDDYILVNHDISINFSEAISISIWVKPIEIPTRGARMIIGKSNYQTHTNYMLLLL